MSDEVKDEVKDGTPPVNGGEDKQAELDRQFAERGKRGAEAERKKLWEALGVSNQEGFDAFVKAKKESEDAQKSELQRLADVAQTEKGRADKLEAESKAQLEAAQTRVVNMEIKLLASQPATDKDGKVTRAAFRKDALDDVALLIERAEIKDEGGKLTGVDKALDALAKGKPWMLEDGKQPAAPTKGSPPPPSGTKQNQNAAPASVVVSKTL